MLGHEWLWRRSQQRKAPSHLVGCLLHEVAVDPQELFSRGARVQDHPGEHDRPNRMEAKLELGHHAEVPAAAPEPPEEVWILVCTGPDDATIGGHDLRRDEALAGCAELAVDAPRPT